MIQRNWQIDETCSLSSAFTVLKSRRDNADYFANKTPLGGRIQRLGASRGSIALASFPVALSCDLRAE